MTSAAKMPPTCFPTTQHKKAPAPGAGAFTVNLPI